MTGDLLFEPSPTRPTWLVTLADLALLLVGTLVLFQAVGRERDAAAASIRQAFDGDEAPPMPVAAARLDGFTPGSAVLPGSTGPLAAWANDALRDPRVTVTITGEADGTPADTDRASGSAAILAADRARAIVTALIARGAPPARLRLAARTGSGRAVTATLAFERP